MLVFRIKLSTKEWWCLNLKDDRRWDWEKRNFYEKASLKVIKLAWRI